MTRNSLCASTQYLHHSVCTSPRAPLPKGEGDVTKGLAPRCDDSITPENAPRVLSAHAEQPRAHRRNPFRPTPAPPADSDRGRIVVHRPTQATLRSHVPPPASDRRLRGRLLLSGLEAGHRGRGRDPLPTRTARLGSGARRSPPTHRPPRHPP